jgi:diketogulonate reductase-like aldo/keto reductase
MATPGITTLLKLRNGATMPALGFGTWQGATDAPAGPLTAAINVAVAHGFRHIDCAALYSNEPEIGAALAALVAGGAVARAELFVTSKLWNTEHHPDRVAAACRQTLRDLRLQYLDLYLIHWPVAWRHGAGQFPQNAAGGAAEEPVALLDTWRELEKLVDAGLVRSIGVSNWSAAQLDELCAAARIQPAVNQVEVGPGCQNAAVRAANARHGVVTAAYCPLGGQNGGGFLADPAFAAIAATYGMTGAALALQWNLQAGNAVLAKSVTAERVAANAAMLVGALPDAAMADVAAYGDAHPHRGVNPRSFQAVPGPFFPQGSSRPVSDQPLPQDQ